MPPQAAGGQGAPGEPAPQGDAVPGCVGLTRCWRRAGCTRLAPGWGGGGFWGRGRSWGGCCGAGGGAMGGQRGGGVVGGPRGRQLCARGEEWLRCGEGARKPTQPHVWGPWTQGAPFLGRFGAGRVSSPCPEPPQEPAPCPHPHGHIAAPPAPHSRWMTMASRRAMRKRRTALIRATQSQVNLQSARYLPPTRSHSCRPAGGRGQRAEHGATMPPPRHPLPSWLSLASCPL